MWRREMVSAGRRGGQVAASSAAEALGGGAMGLFRGADGDAMLGMRLRPAVRKQCFNICVAGCGQSGDPIAQLGRRIDAVTTTSRH